VQRGRAARQRHTVPRRRGRPRLGRPGVVLSACRGGADDLAAGCLRGLGRESFERLGDMTAEVGFCLRKRRGRYTREWKYREMVDELDSGTRCAITQRAADRAQRIEHLGQGPIGCVTVQQFRYAPAE
jgi:hypothetical protein